MIEPPIFDLPVYLRVGTSIEREIGSITVRPDRPARAANAALAELLHATADELQREAS